MLKLPRCITLLLLVAVAPLLRADRSLDQACLAQSVLGAEVWSRLIRIENRTVGGPYPRNLHALVFELAGILWFYAATDGTQSFSLHLGRLEEEKADFGSLLRAIDPGFTRWSEVKPKLPVIASRRGQLSNGCFIESVAELRARLARGERVDRPQLLSYYEETSAGLHGHTVLVLGRGAHWEIFDPGRPTARLSVTKRDGADALALARALEGSGVVKARSIQLDFLAAAREAGIGAIASKAGSVDERPGRS
ncbi:MAG: hypothetical protein ABIQ12_09290 [Opitutaceae bacterium]